MTRRKVGIWVWLPIARLRSSGWSSRRPEGWCQGNGDAPANKIGTLRNF